MNDKFCLDVHGPWAIWTRPENRVERTSYDVMTPSGGRGLIASICWKPGMVWGVSRIDVLNPIRRQVQHTNEVKLMHSVTQIRTAMNSGKRIAIYPSECRERRSSSVLMDVHYRIYCDFEFIPDAVPPEKRRPDFSREKYENMFRRRASRGQCHHQPFLGHREFPAFFRLVDPNLEPATPINDSRDLGIMFFDYDWDSGDVRPEPLWFHAVMDHGTVMIPDRHSPEIIRPSKLAENRTATQVADVSDSVEGD